VCFASSIDVYLYRHRRRSGSDPTLLLRSWYFGHILVCLYQGIAYYLKVIHCNVIPCIPILCTLGYCHFPTLYSKTEALRAAKVHQLIPPYQEETSFVSVGIVTEALVTTE
jgi:hypothetical protein